MATTNNWFLISDEGAATWASINVEEVSPSADKAVTYNVYDFQAVYTDSVQLFYNVNSTLSLIQGGGTFPFTDATADIGVSYQIIQQVASNDATCTYAMRQAIEQLHEVTYTVYTGVELSSVEITYSVSGAVDSESIPITYTVFSGVETDSAVASYDVIKAITKDSVATYSLTSTPLTATNVSEVTYSILQAIEKNSTCTYYVLGYVEKDNVTTYRLLNDADLNKVITYNVVSSVYVDRSIEYGVGLVYPVEKDGALYYNIFSNTIPTPNLVGLTLEKGLVVLQNSGIPLGTITYVS